jgi:hypothetical protein
MVGRAFAVPHEDQQHYTDWPDPQRLMLAAFDCYLERLSPVEEDWDGTIGVLTTTVMRLPGHVGIFSTVDGVRHLIHARMSERKVLEQRFDSDPRSRETVLVARYGFPGLED